jgi:hypothetical protein
MLVTFGPDNGKIYEPETGLVIASTDIIAHDMANLAWLEIGRDKDPAGWPVLINDPYESSDATVDMMNRAVVYMLGGLGEAGSAQKLMRYNVRSIWEDPTLNAAFKIFGHVPGIVIENPSGSVPPSLKDELVKRVTFN